MRLAFHSFVAALLALAIPAPAQTRQPIKVRCVQTEPCCDVQFEFEENKGHEAPGDATKRAFGEWIQRVIR